MKQIVFGSFDHPFQDGYKSSVIQILFPWLVQGGYLNHLLWYFLYARTVTKSWCSVGMFFDRCTNCKFINWYPDMTIWILVQCTVFLTEKNLNYYHIGGHFREYQNKCFWRTKCFGKCTSSVYGITDIKREGTSSVYGIADIKWEGTSSVYTVSEIKWENPFSSLVLHE